MHKASPLVQHMIGVVTVAGIFAPLFPYVDVFNHFRPWILITAVLTLVVATLFSSASSVKALIAYCIINLSLFLTPLVANPANLKVTHASKLNLLTFNFLSKNQKIGQVTDFLERVDVDVILLQEFPEKYKTRLFSRLSVKYPHIHSCDCRGQVLLSKRPWSEAGGQQADHTKPPLIWAKFTSETGNPYRVVGLHPYFPLKPELHGPNYLWLSERFPKFQEPIILAGDFNATPWSWVLNRFSWANGLRRGGTFTFSWPGHWLYQFLLIDNVFVTPSLEVTEFNVGPDLGSDHRPVLATIALP